MLAHYFLLSLSSFTSPVWKLFHFVFDNHDNVFPNWYYCTNCGKLIYCNTANGNRRLTNHVCYVRGFEAPNVPDQNDADENVTDDNATEENITDGNDTDGNAMDESSSSIDDGAKKH